MCLNIPRYAYISHIFLPYNKKIEFAIERLKDSER